MRIKEQKLRWCLSFLFVLIVMGCDSDLPDKAYRNLSLSVYEDEVRDITPYTSAENGLRSMPRSDNGTYQCLDDWDHWKPDMDQLTYTVLDKLFDPESGDEGIYGPVQSLDRFINNVNVHKVLLDGLGETVNNYGGNSSTFTVLSIEPQTIEVPFFGNEVSVDRIVKHVTGTGETEYMAFTIDEQNEAESLVAFATSNFNGPLQMVIYGERDNATNMTIKTAIHLIYDAPSTDSFRGQFEWQGNLNDEWFSITQCTDAAGGNWQVLGGGSIAAGKGGMSFMSRNEECGNAWYYIENITNEQIKSEEQPGDPISFDADPPDGSTVALEYIAESSLRFPGLLEMYPTEEITCGWCTDQD